MNRATWRFPSTLLLAVSFLAGCHTTNTGNAGIGGAGGIADGGSGGSGNEGGTGGTCPEDWSVDLIQEGPPRSSDAGVGREFEFDGVIEAIGPRVHGSGDYRVIALRSVPGAFIRLFYKDPDARLLPPFAIGDRASVRLVQSPSMPGLLHDYFAFRFRNHENGAEWELVGLDKTFTNDQGPSFSFVTEDVRFSIGKQSLCTPDGSDSLYPLSAGAKRFPEEALELRPFEPAQLEIGARAVTVMASGVFGSRYSSDPEALFGMAIAMVSRPPREDRTPCDSANPCPDGFFCDLAEDRCAGPGFCQPWPSECAPEANVMLSQHVCACDGQVYHSVCAANLNGTDVSFSEMTCPSDYFLCGAMACRAGEPCFRSLEGQRSADYCLYRYTERYDCDDAVVCGCLPDAPACECSDDTPLPGAVTLLCSESESGG